MPLLPPHCVATGVIKHASSSQYPSTLHVPRWLAPTHLAPAYLRTLVWEPLRQMLAALLQAAAMMFSRSRMHHPRLHRHARALPPAAEQSLALLLHMAPTCAGRWEHLVSPTTLDALPHIPWHPRGQRSGVDIALCPATPPQQPLHTVRGEGHIAAPAAVVLAFVEGVHTVAQWEPAYRDGHVLRDATVGNVRTQLLWSRHAAGMTRTPT